MFTAALFTTAKIRKQPKWPPTDECIRRCGIYCGILLGREKEHFAICSSMDGLGGPECEGLTDSSEISLTEKDKYYMISLMCGFQKKKKRY